MTAVVVQLASTTRGAAGLGFGFLGAMYALRAIADSADSGTWVHALGWLSPLGWAGRVEAYGADRQWVLLLGLLTLVGGVLVGVAVLDRRDLGAGLIPARDGPRRAGPPAHGTRRARHPAGPRDDHRLDRRHGPRRCRRGLAARLRRRPRHGPRHPGPPRAARRHGRLVRGHLRRHRDPLRRRRPSPPRGSPSCCASSGPSARASARSCSRPRPAAPGGSAPTSPAGGPHHRAHGAARRSRRLVGPSVTPEAPSFGASVGAALAALPAVWVMIGVAAALAGAFPRFAPFSWGVLLVTFLVDRDRPDDRPALVGPRPLAVHAPLAPAGRRRSSPCPRRCSPCWRPRSWAPGCWPTAAATSPDRRLRPGPSAGCRMPDAGGLR